jgi:N utilization substance protein B
MGRARDIRRCALQALYQFDSGAADRPDDVRASLEESPGDERAHADGFALACAAWEMREEADRSVAAITPDWPTHRQPVVDRNLLRLAYYEMASGRTPPKVVINEAVELAKEFSTERSPMFINGVLDKLYRARRADAPAAGDDAPVGPAADAPEGRA